MTDALRKSLVELYKKMGYKDERSMPINPFWQDTGPHAVNDLALAKALHDVLDYVHSTVKLRARKPARLGWDTIETVRQGEHACGGCQCGIERCPVHD